MKQSPIGIIGSALTTSLGTTREQTWQAIAQGKCGIALPTEIESPLPLGADAGQAANLPADFAADLPREARYLKWTIEHALADAGLVKDLPERTGVMVGTTLHGVRAAGEFLRTQNATPLRHFLAGNTLELAIKDLDIKGFCATTCSACSSSLGAIALAVTLLQTGKLDLVIAGGYDVISEYAYGGFNSLRLVADGPLLPFSRNRRGMKLAEGYGIVVLQRIDEASAEKYQAIIGGFGESADAHHLTQPHPEGRGAKAAMTGALQAAGIGPDQIGMVAAHATATPDNDAGEYAALHSVFGEKLRDVPVVGFKSHLGHTLGGAGAVELILSACALREQLVPPCANVKKEDVEFANLNVNTAPHPAAIQHTLNTSLGFGGANTCMILRNSKVRSLQTSEESAPIEVAITGIGVLIPGAIGNEAFTERMSQPIEMETLEAGAIPEEVFIHLLNARRIRRMSDYVKLSLAAAHLACTNAGVEQNAEFLRQCSVLLGTTHGSATFCTQYYGDIVKQGLIGANPTLFAEGVPNAAAAHLSLMLGIQGACQTIIGTRTAGLDALNLAAMRIASGQWSTALVGAAEEHSPTVADVYRHCNLSAQDKRSLPFESESGFVSGAGAVCFVLENAEIAKEAGRRIYGMVSGSVSAHRSRPHMGEGVATVLNELGERMPLIASANATWLDRAEQFGIERAWGGLSRMTMYGHAPEMFSVGSLAAIAGGLLGAWILEKQFASLCTDYSGCIAATVIERT